MRLSTDHGSKLLEQRKKRSIRQIVNFYQCIHLIMQTKCSWKSAGQFGATAGSRERVERMPKTNVLEMKREQVCHDKAY